MNTMPNFLSLLMLTIIVGVTCHPIQRRQTEDDRCTVITNVCTILWHIQDTMEHCPAGSACNSTAMGIIHSVIRTDFSAWVRWLFDENTMRALLVMFLIQVNAKGACQECTSSVISSSTTCSSITVEKICSATYNCHKCIFKLLSLFITVHFHVGVCMLSLLENVQYILEQNENTFLLLSVIMSIHSVGWTALVTKTK